MPLDLQSLRGIISGISPTLQKFTKAVEENLYTIRDYINNLRLNSSVLKPTSAVDFNNQNIININLIDANFLAIDAPLSVGGNSSQYIYGNSGSGYRGFTFLLEDGALNGGHLFAEGGLLYFGLGTTDYFYIDTDTFLPINNTATLGNNSNPFQGIYSQNIYSNVIDAIISISAGDNAGNTGTIYLKGSTSGTVTLETQNVAGTWTLTLPTNAGASGQFLQTDGAGVTTWATASGGGGGITWTEVTGTTQTMAVDNAYIANNASQVVFTLPSTAAVGKVVRVSGKGAGGWKIAQNASGIIHFGNVDTTIGTGGYIQSTHKRDSVELVCVVANNEWNVISSVGNIDYA